MISKSEVIIANELATAGIVYEYEREFIGTDGTPRYPDFTTGDADTGITWYWEHLGIPGVGEYEEKWKAKPEWHRKNDVLPVGEGGGDNGILPASNERNGIDDKQIARPIGIVRDGV